MHRIHIEISEELFSQILGHLLPCPARNEEAGFGYADIIEQQGVLVFNVKDWDSLGETDYSLQYGDYLELTDQTRAKIIKKAHDKKRALMEFHSHPYSSIAYFSHADRLGLNEFVPHVWWRLKEQPYGAIVVSPKSFDGLCWVDGPQVPEAPECIKVGPYLKKPTQKTLDFWRSENVK